MLFADRRVNAVMLQLQGRHAARVVDGEKEEHYKESHTRAPRNQTIPLTWAPRSTASSIMWAASSRLIPARDAGIPADTPSPPRFWRFSDGDGTAPVPCGTISIVPSAKTLLARALAYKPKREKYRSLSQLSNFTCTPKS